MANEMNTATSAKIHQSSYCYPALCFLLLLCAPALQAGEIYHWVDENGVAHFTEKAPAGNRRDVQTLSIDNEPASNDPDEDIYDIEGQAERMAALREDMASRRDEARKAQAAAPKVVYKPYEVVRYGIGYRNPYRPHPRPPKPVQPIEPPVVDPYPTHTLKPLGSGKQRR